MDTIFITGSVLSGRHGVYDEEREKDQRFQIDIEIKQGERDWQENIANTYNYMDAHAIAREFVENKSFNLIETLGESILNEILKNPLAKSASITIKKLDVIPPAEVGVTLTRSK
jgi:dihydroneopterin aldolase